MPDSIIPIVSILLSLALIIFFDKRQDRRLFRVVVLLAIYLLTSFIVSFFYFLGLNFLIGFILVVIVHFVAIQKVLGFDFIGTFLFLLGSEMLAFLILLGLKNLF